MPLHRLLHALFLLVLVFILIGCGNAQVQTYRTVLPAALTRCQDEPRPPADISDDLALVEWIEAVRLAGEDCRQIVARVREINQEASND